MVNVPAVMVIDCERMESVVRVSYHSYTDGSLMVNNVLPVDWNWVKP